MLIYLSTETNRELHAIMEDYGSPTKSGIIRDLIHREFVEMTEAKAWEFVEMTEAEALRNEGG